jgi:hypothetical protein
MLSTPLSELTRRRMLAGALALAINSGFIALILFTPRDAPLNLDARTIDVILVSTPEPEPVAQPEQVVEADQNIPIEQEAEVTAEPAPETEPVEPLVDTDLDPEDEIETEPMQTSAAPAGRLESFSGDALPYPAGRGSTAFVLRETFCLNSSDANREAGNCPHDPERDGLGLLQYTGSHDLSELRERFGLDLSPDEIRVLHGVAPHALAGQPVIDSARRSTSSSDEMRETLPASRPDPAFGD